MRESNVSVARGTDGRLLLLLAEETEALLFVLLLVFLALAGAGFGRQGDGCRERVGAAGGGRALVARRDLGFLGGRGAAAGVLDGLNPCVHLLLQTHTHTHTQS